MKAPFTICMAALALLGGIATAQTPVDTPATTPAVTPTTGTSTGTPITTMTAAEANANFAGQRTRTGERVRRDNAGPFAKLTTAQRLDSLTEEQRTRIQEFIDQNKAEGEQLQAEFREAMQQARNTTGTREVRRDAMQGVRQKFQAAEQRIDTFLQEVLTEEQQNDLRQRATRLRDNAGQRVRGIRDGSTTATATGERPERRGWGQRNNRNERGERGDREDRRARREAQRELRASRMGQTTQTTALDGATSIPQNPAAPE